MQRASEKSVAEQKKKVNFLTARRVFGIIPLMRFGRTEKRNTIRRFGTAFAAVLVWLFVCAAPAFAFVSPAAGQSAPCPENPAKSVRTGVSQIPAAESGQTLENLSAQKLPVASDETESGRVYATGDLSPSHEKTPGPKLSAFMENAGLAHLFTNHSSAVFFSDKEAEASSLTIIHFLHDQDGLKG